ncbi:MAG: right-handed parallel beta-helix repeat-containing protein [Sandaracinaceae bacterium]|nr:right-handed parallel beta-helix repeat-containing protein [Sandaracinaceae bacterium]
MRRFTVLFLCFSILGCDGEGEPVDGGGRADAGDGPRDAGEGPRDAGDGSRDASGLDDASAPADAGARDAGPTPAECALAAPFDEGVTYARTLHVSPTGSASGDGSAASPLDTIPRAAARATPGTRVLVAAGTYPGGFRLDGIAGAPGQPIAIVADGEVVLDAGGSGTVVSMTDPEYLVFEGFTLRGAGVHGMNIDDGGSYATPAHHLILRNLTIPSAGSGGNNDCIKMSGVDDFWVLGSDVAACDRGEGIDMVGCHRGLISGNHFHDVVGTAVQAKGGSADVVVHGNRFTDIPSRGVNAGGSTGLEFFRPIDAPHEAARITVVANLFRRVGAESGASIAFTGCDACVFAQNTIVEPRTWVARILQETTGARFVPSRNGHFVNNVIVLDTSAIRTFVNVGGNTAPETFTFANNLWFATNQGAGWSGPSYPAEIPAETGSVIQQDPLLDANGRPMSGSPAAGIGRTLSITQPPDHDGRCYGTPPSAGAFELAGR